MPSDAAALLQVDLPVEDEVVQFITSEHTYRVDTGRGLRLDIGRVHTFQPDIQDSADFYTYLWVEARQGWFLLSQRFLDGVAQRWTVWREMIPRDRVNFFLEFADALPGYVEQNLPRAGS